MVNQPYQCPTLTRRGSSREGQQQHQQPHYDYGYGADRGAYSASVSTSGHETRATPMSDREAEPEPSTPRKRIAVACKRCRKRKIRCSGDPGNGGPCNGCKNSGNVPCLFLRVQSTEAPFKTDSQFNYNIDTSRTYQVHRGVTPPIHGLPHYGPEVTSVAVADPSLAGAYRGAAAAAAAATAAYPYSNRYYSSVSGWGGPGSYADETLGYSGMPYPAYPYVGGDAAAAAAATAHMVSPYRKASSSASVYIDPTDAAGYGYAHTAPLVHRPATVSLSGESSTYSLSTAPSSLPAAAGSSASQDRMLPAPVPSLHTAALQSNYGQPSSSLPATKPGAAVSSVSAHSSPTSSLSEAAVGYGAYDSSPGFSTAPSPAAAALPSLTTPRLSVSADPYAVHAAPSDQLYSPVDTTPVSAGSSLRSQSGGSSDSLYRYMENARRGSSSAHNHGHSQPHQASSASSCGGLQNGQAYRVPEPLPTVHHHQHHHLLPQHVSPYLSGHPSSGSTSSAGGDGDTAAAGSGNGIRRATAGELRAS